MKIFHYINRTWDILYNIITLKRNKVDYKKDLNIRGRIYIRNNGNIKISSGVKFNSGLFPNPVGGNNRIILSVDYDANLTIGNNVGISNAELVVKNGITIEDDVMIGGGVKIYDSDFHPLSFEKRKKTPNDGKSIPIIIKRGAFIGAHAIILKGVTVGQHSVVGAGSVVTKNIPDNEIWAGNPACFIRRL